MDIKNSGLDLINYEIWYEPFWKTNFFYLVISIILFLIFSISSVLLFKLFKNKKLKHLSNLDRFYYNIDLLSKSKENDTRKFYMDLILILKEYLSSTYNYNFFTNTEDELINSLKSYNLPQDFISKLAPIAQRAQMAKFANYAINEDQTLQDLSALKSMVSLIESSITSNL